MKIKALTDNVTKKMRVNYETMEKTLRCAKNFICLTGNEECLCKVETTLDDRILIVNCEGKSPVCGYKLEFGYSTVCTCPTRDEIYKKYNV